MKNLLLIISLLVFTVFCFGQKKTSFGIKAGINMANISGNIESEWDINTESKFGFHAGFIMDVAVSEKFSVQPELLYTAQGAKFNDEGSEGKFIHNFISLPITAKYYIIDDLALETGPQLNYLIKAKLEESMDVGWDSGDLEVDLTKQAPSISVGLNFGASYEINNKFIIGARYSLGLTNLATHKRAEIKYLYDGEEYETDEPFWDKGFTMKSNAIQFSLAYKFL